MSACQTNKVIETKITLPPMPERRELNENLSEIEVLIYYESLVQKFELWGEEVNEIIEIYNLRRDAVKEKQ